MIKYFIPIFFISINLSFSQTLPKVFEIGTASGFQVSSSENPASNSINDVLIVGDTIWLATSRGLSRSTDKGVSWNNYYGTTAFGTESITALGYYQGIIWAATAHSIERDGQTLPEGSGLRFSTNNGEGWYTVGQPLDAENDSIEVYGINNIRALPVTVAVQNIIYDITFTPNTIWIATFAGGARKNNIDSLIINQNNKWKRVVIPPDRLSSISPTDTLNFSLQPVGGKFGKENNLNHRVFSIFSINDSTVLIGTANGINKSVSNVNNSPDGISWIKLNHQNQIEPISGNFVVALDYSKNQNIIWAATWKAEDQDEFYGVSYSTDNGISWRTTLRDEKVHNFGIDNIGGFVIATSSNGAFLNIAGMDRWLLPGQIVDKVSKLKLRTKHFYSAGFLGNESIWLGSADGLVKNSTVSQYWKDDWKIYFASQPLENIEDTYAYPNPFSPRTEQVKIKYGTGGKSVQATIRIFNFNMNIVRTVIQNAARGNPYHAISSSDSGVIDFWDGKDDSGVIVPNGVYFYRIDIDSNDPIYGKIMVLQ
jgi:hypothetical protein